MEGNRKDSSDKTESQSMRAANSGFIFLSDYTKDKLREQDERFQKVMKRVKKQEIKNSGCGDDLEGSDDELICKPKHYERGGKLEI